MSSGHRSPDNPTFWWGNFVLLEHPPGASQAGHWLDVFHAEFPDCGHVAIGFDGTTGTREDVAGFVDLGLRVDTSSVMTAQSVHPPAHPNHHATYRTLESDEDWAAHVALWMAIDDVDDVEAHLRFVTAKVVTSRALTQAGHGAWFGAFVEGRMLSSTGLVRADGNLARFQNVETHPDARGQGLAGTLVHHVSRYGLDELGVATLVMVADPDYLAIRVYRAVGFTPSETQLQVERPNRGAGADEATAAASE